MSGEADCIFCQIVSGGIPCLKIYEDADTLAFMDINPASQGHALVVPKAHFGDAYSISDEAASAVVRTATRVARAVREALEPEGLNLLQCNGPAAAQTVQHFHMHVLPRTTGDGLKLNWGLKPGNMEAIGTLAERIRAKL